MNFASLLENSLLVHRCTVFKWLEYEFEDTIETRDKYCITLNCRLNEFPINIILTTSRYDNHYYSKPEHMIDCVVINSQESRYFNAEKTILDLKNIILEDESKIREAYENGFFIECGPLEHNLVVRLEQAIENSELLDPYKINKLLCKDR